LPGVTILEVRRHEVRVVSSRKEAFQALSISKNIAWNPLTFCAKEIEESVDRSGNTPVNQGRGDAFAVNPILRRTALDSTRD
jgi:hypothetical protein